MKTLLHVGFLLFLPEAAIYVYDNNSTDHTDEIARNAGAIVRYEYRQGKKELSVDYVINDKG